MFYFSKRLNNILINCSPIIYCKTDPEDDTKLIFYLDTGEQVTETYGTAEEAAEWLRIYREAITGSGRYEELEREVEVLSEEVVELSDENAELTDIVEQANEIAENILDIEEVQ